MSDLAAEPIRLTETVVKGGCAAKLPAGKLRQFLSKLELPRPRELVVGFDTLDDACLWDLEDGRYLVQTLDFFTPIVDDAYDFGAIAAANALSDVFAMGGAPKTALTILCFPAATLPFTLIEAMMAGAMSKISEAGACLAGGHSIDDDTIKLGFSVTGFVDKARAWTNSGVMPGDNLILTKPLGTGTITSALKQKKASTSAVAGAVASMKQLNHCADLLTAINVHAATDVTGFGLAGHAMQVAKASNVQLQIETAALPVLAEALSYIRAGVLNKAHHTNAEYVQSDVRYDDVPVDRRWLTLDPQTSGGLLLAVSADQTEAALNFLQTRFSEAVVVGNASSRLGDDTPWLIFR